MMMVMMMMMMMMVVVVVVVVMMIHRCVVAGRILSRSDGGGIVLFDQHGSYTRDALRVQRTAVSNRRRLYRFGCSGHRRHSGNRGLVLPLQKTQNLSAKLVRSLLLTTT